MSLDLHASVSHLPRSHRFAYGLCLVLGVLGLALFVLVLMVEVLTAPGARLSAGMAWTLLAAAFSCWHVAREVRGFGPVGVVRWVLFFGALVSMGVKAALTIQDATMAWFTIAVGGVSAVLIGCARLIARKALAPGSDAELA